MAGGEGTVVADRFQVHELIGLGGSGCRVHRALDLRLNQPVALKLFPPQYTDADYVHRLKREAELAARLRDHPNVVSTYDVGETDGGFFYIAMQHIDGTDLERLIRDRGPLDLHRTCVILSQVADALDAAHAANLVHRDVKPSNIFVVQPSDPEARVKAYIGDFGQSLRSDLRVATGSLYVGTPAYMAPESWNGDQPAPPVDVYALGCVVYSCLTGHPPFAASTSEDVRRAHTGLAPPRLSRFLYAVPPAVDDVLARALAKKPGRRYPTCTDFINALWQAGSSAHPGAATPPGLSPGTPTVPHRPPRLLAKGWNSRRLKGLRERAQPVLRELRAAPRWQSGVAVGAIVAVVAGGVTLGILSGTEVAGTPTAMSTIAGAREALGGDINGLTLGDDGSLYLVSIADHRVQKLTPEGLTTISGGNGPGLSGDDGPATEAKLDTPQGIAVAGDGTVYVADNGNNVVRKIDPRGTITTFAGTGETTSSGDGGPASEAGLASPVDVTLDEQGRLYVAEADGNRVRMIDGEGTITTIAGTGAAGYSGDGGIATGAQLSYPLDVEFGRGSLYIADIGNNRIRQIDGNGVITTVAGNGTAGAAGDGGPATQAEVDAPEALAIGADGTIYFADRFAHKIRRIDPSGTITTIAGTSVPGYTGDGGPANGAQLAGPSAIAVTPEGVVYFADAYNNRIRRITPDGTISTLAGSGLAYPRDGGSALNAFLYGPQVARYDETSGSLYIADADHHRVRKVSSEGVITTIAGTGTPGNAGDGGAAAKATLNYPTGIAFDTRGNVLISDADNHRVRAIGRGGVITTVAGTGEGKAAGDGTPAAQTSLARPVDVAAHPDGGFYIAEVDANRIRRVSPDGVLTTVAGTGAAGFSGDGGPARRAKLRGPTGVHVADDGSLYIADYGNRRVRKVSPDGTITTVAGNGKDRFSGDNGPATKAGMCCPVTVTTDAEGNLYIAGDESHRVRKVDPDGTITTIAGTGEAGTPLDGDEAAASALDTPVGVDVDPNGQLYVTDWGSDEVYVIGTDGRIRTAAGTDW